MIDLAAEYMEIFAGLDRAYGTYILTGQKDEFGKAKGDAKTVKEQVTEVLWVNHLDGTLSIGICPINDNNECRWGCIDVDKYTDLDMRGVNKLVQDNNLPLVCCRSKSGGIHIFVFLSDYIGANIMRQKLRQLAAFLGFGGCEIFPKQDEILKDRGDVGSWLNMPYFDANKTVRYGIDKQGDGLSGKEFLTYVKSRMITAKEFEEFVVPTMKSEMFKDGPPCMQQLHANGIGPGMRNVFVFNAATYFKMSEGDDWKKHLEKYNGALSSPLPTSELAAMVKSLSKDYQYQCKKEPLASCCNSQLCRLRKYGVGEESGIQIQSIRKFMVDPIQWFINLEGGGVVECNTEEMMSPNLFAKKCVEVVNKIPITSKAQAWQKMINEKLQEVTVIDVPSEGTGKGMFLDYLERYCNSLVQAQTKDEILLGKPFTESGRTYFKITGLMQYLDRQKFSALKPGPAIALIKSHKDLDCQHHTDNFKGKCCNYWSIISFEKQTKAFDIKPKEEKEHAY